jgi:hypothetical protein
VLYTICDRFALLAPARGPSIRVQPPARNALTQTAGPLDRLSTTAMTAASSATFPITPSSASTSLTNVPFPTPPMDGLHDSSPVVVRLEVRSKVRAPEREEGVAASHLAWPAPTMRTS